MKLGDCVHFNGVGNRTCDAGVVYDELTGRPADTMLLPCLAFLASRGKPVATCELKRPATDEDVAAYLVEVDQRLARMALVALALDPLRKPSSHGSFPCPACTTGTVKYSIARNGHAWVKCSTPKCCGWME